MRVECPNCGGAHPAWDCKRPATKSTALRLDAATVSQGGRATAGNPNGKEARKQVQSLPVDTHNPSSRKGSGVESLRTPTEGRKGRDSTSEGARAKLRDPSAVLTQTAAQLPVGTPTKRPRGRPRIHPDRKAYKAQWERDKRKRLKEGK